MQPTEIRKICCIGAGYVGGSTMAVIADHCPNIQVKVIDINSSRIDAWNSADLAELPIFEPGLDMVIDRCRGRNLFFTTNLELSIAESDMVFISVNTPTKSKGLGAGKASDLKWVEASARQVAKFSKSHTIVVEKSTLPVRTAETIQKILAEAQEATNQKNQTKTFAVLSNPEFLSEGNAINDLEQPDRVLIGGEDQNAIEALANLYLNWIPPEKILRTNIWSSELSKLAANAFLAQRISSINSISALCEATGADIKQVAKAIGTDSRIGSKFLDAGPGFGGSCFQKDILNLVYLCEYYGLTDAAQYWQEVVNLNNWQKKRIARLIVNRLFGNVAGKRVAIFGFAFKANTNDTRESPCIKICTDLLEEGAHLAIYDPKVSKDQITKNLQLKPNQDKNQNIIDTGLWTYCNSILEAAKYADCIVILTDWDEFKEINWSKLSEIMRKPSWIFDTRACINYPLAKQAGFNIWRVGFQI